MPTILTGKDISDYMDNLVAEIKDWNAATEANGGAENAFGVTGSERIWGYSPEEYGFDLMPAAQEPIIVCAFAGWEKPVKDASIMEAEEKSGASINYKSLFKFRAIVLLIWANEARDVVIQEGRDYASSLDKWLDEHNIKGWAEFALSQGGAPLYPENEMQVMGKAGYRIMHYAERDILRTRRYVDETP